VEFAEHVSAHGDCKISSDAIFIHFATVEKGVIIVLTNDGNHLVLAN